MARWKPPVLIAILLAMGFGIIAVSRATGDRGSTEQNIAVWSLVIAAFIVVVLVSAIGEVPRPEVTTGLVLLGVVLVSLLPLGMIAANRAYDRLLVQPVCERLETQSDPVTTFERVSRTADAGVIDRFFTRRLQCHYRTADPAVPEGIPTFVDFRDDRLGGSTAWLYLFGRAVVGVIGFATLFLLQIPVWRWWFHRMMREHRKDPAPA
jgi:hypothetical protein